MNLISSLILAQPHTLTKRPWGWELQTTFSIPDRNDENIVLTFKKGPSHSEIAAMIEFMKEKLVLLHSIVENEGKSEEQIQKISDAWLEYESCASSVVK